MINRPSIRTLRRLLRSILRFKRKIILKLQKEIIQRMIDLVRFLRDKDRVAQVIHQVGQVIHQVGQVTFALLTAEFQYKAHKVQGIILALCDSRTTLAFKWSLIRYSVTSPLVAFTIAFIIYQILWGYLPNRRRLRALMYRIVERPIERLLERVEIFFQTELGMGILSGIAKASPFIIASYIFPFIIRVPPPYPPWWFPLGLRILLILTFTWTSILGF